MYPYSIRDLVWHFAKPVLVSVERRIYELAVHAAMWL